jgi:hypothetical protein
MVLIQPCRIESIVDAGVAKRQTASVYLKALAASNILDERKFGRDKLFVHTRFLRLLTRDDNSFKRYVVIEGDRDAECKGVVRLRSCVRT